MGELAREEHHRLDDPRAEQEASLVVARPLVQHVGADAGEGEGEQPVVQVAPPQAVGEAGGHRDDDAADEEEGGRGGPRARRAHLPIVPAGGRGDTGIPLDLPPGFAPWCRGPLVGGSGLPAENGATMTTTRPPVDRPARVTDDAATHTPTPEQRLLTGSLVVAPLLYLAADSTYAVRGWDDPTAGLLHVLGAVGYGFVVLCVARWLPAGSRLRAALLVAALVGMAGNVAYGFEAIHMSFGDVQLVDRPGAANLIKPLGLVFPLSLLLVAAALRRLGARWQAVGVLWPRSSGRWPTSATSPGSPCRPTSSSCSPSAASRGRPRSSGLRTGRPAGRDES